MARPHHTLVTLSAPVLLSLVAEPLAGMADTAFVARLGAAPLAALGVATTLLSSVFWVFNFLAIGTQTEVSRAHGGARVERAPRVATLALALSAALGTALALISWPWLAALAGWMGADGAVRDAAVVYLEIRLLGAPAMLVLLAAFGALRGLLDMRTPLWIAAAVSAVNVVLDPLLIFGAGPIPAYGVAGAAWATTASQWLGALWGVAAVARRPGIAGGLRAREALALLVVGRDLFLRTGLLLAFQVLATRTANRAGAEAGAAHQAVRQIWLLTALILDAYAASSQSLVAYFAGAARVDLARRVARVACQWSTGTGLVLTGAMLIGEPAVAALLVPEVARAPFHGAWWVLAVAQPVNALSFATDGIHWGAGDYGYLRNGMLVASFFGCGLLLAIDVAAPRALQQVWLATGAWILLRAAIGTARIWPGVGRGPLRAAP